MRIVVPWEPGDTRTMVTPTDSICQYTHMKQRNRPNIDTWEQRFNYEG
jgi:hypothetical protein